MSYYAVDAVTDALEATRSFLWPVDLGRWARLALVVFFLGGAGSGFSPFQFPGGTPGGGGPGGSDVPPTGSLPAIGGPELAVIFAIVGIGAVLLAAFLLAGSIMEFVFVESLREEAVAIRRYWGRYWRRGVRLFGFRLVFGILTLGAFLIVGGVAFAPLFLGDGGLSIALVVIAIPILVALAILTGLVGGFTTMFVVPIMLVEDRGVVSAWRRFWPTLTAQWREYAVYAFLGFVLQIAAGIGAGIATLVGALAVGIPLGIVAVVGVGLLSVVELAGWVLIALAALLFVFAVLVLSLFVSVPVQTYLRYYALFVLGDTESDFDLIADRRRAVRATDADGTAS